jgi:hypothetical protein
MLNHGTTYVIYAPFIQRIINYNTDMEFVYDGKHGSYQAHVVWGPAVPPSPTAAAGTSAVALDSPSTHAPSPPAASRPAPSATPESSRATTHRGKK